MVRRFRNCFKPRLLTFEAKHARGTCTYIHIWLTPAKWLLKGVNCFIHVSQRKYGILVFVRKRKNICSVKTFHPRTNKEWIFISSKRTYSYCLVTNTVFMNCIVCNNVNWNHTKYYANESRRRLQLNTTRPSHVIFIVSIITICELQ